MNSSVISWISQQSPLQLYQNIQCHQSTTGMDSSMMMNKCDFMDSFDEDFTAVFGQDIQKYLSPASNSVVSSSTVTDIPQMEQAKQQMPDNYSKFSTIHNFGNPDQTSSAPIILNFGNQNPSENVQQAEPMRWNPVEDIVHPRDVFKSPSTHNANYEEVTARVVQPAKKKRIRLPSQTYDHIIAERRRREQLSQLFVALSALVPGLKKMDKSSILEDAIQYMKLLKERVKVLEEKMEKKAMESVVIVKKSQMVVDDDDDDEGSSSNEQRSSFDEHPLPEIEARVCNNRILVKVHCEKQKDALMKLICKVESLDMIVISTNATEFANVALDITIVAEMEKEFNLTVKEVVTALRATLQLPA